MIQLLCVIYHGFPFLFWLLSLQIISSLYCCMLSISQIFFQIEPLLQASLHTNITNPATIICENSLYPKPRLQRATMVDLQGFNDQDSFVDHGHQAVK